MDEQTSLAMRHENQIDPTVSIDPVHAIRCNVLEAGLLATRIWEVIALEEFYRTTHLIENERVQLAVDYLVHELAKIVPGCSHQQLRESILGHAPDAAAGDVRVRDFWNLFCAVASGWRIKDLHQLVTASNFRWERRRVPLENLVPSQEGLGWLANVRPFSFASAITYLLEGRVETATDETRLHRGGRHSEDAEDPLIGMALPDGHIHVLDGNGRLKARIEMAAARGDEDVPEERMDVWVATGTGEPRDYWIPTSCMFLLGRLVRDVERVDSMLAGISPIGAKEFGDRVLPYLPH